MLNRSLLMILLVAPLGYASRVGPFVALPNQPTVNAFQRDATGNLYLAGSSTSGAFVAKLSSTGSVLFWTTLGGSSETLAMAVSSDGSITAIGGTSSAVFPVTANAAQSVYPGFNTGFFARLGTDGKVLYASYLNSNTSGANFFTPHDLVVDSTGASYITGQGLFASTSGALAGNSGLGHL